MKLSSIDKIILFVSICLSGAMLCAVLSSWNINPLFKLVVAWWTGYFAAKSIEK